MTIKYSDGRRIEGMILTHGNGAMRVALKGADDPVNFAFMAGTWVSEDCEPVEVESTWDQRHPKGSVTEADCICSKEVAARLIHLLLNGSEADQLTAGIHLEQPINECRGGWPV